VFYGRKNKWTAAMRGSMLAAGRRPWLALGLTSMFHAT
jgi:hypothetical protein